MSTFKRILLIAPSEMTRTPAFDRAHALACATGALLHIVAFDYVKPLALAGLFDHDAMAQAREGYLQIHRHWLEQQVRFHRRAGLEIHYEVVWAKPSPAHVLAYVNDFRADLVVKDAQHVSALDRTFHQPLDWLLLRDCTACLHLVTNARHPKPLKVLAAVDLSHLEELTYGLNERVLEFASTLARACDAQLHLLNVSNWSVMGDPPMSVPTLSLENTLSDAVNDAQAEAFDALAERYGIDWAHQHVLTGIPHKVISLFARQNAFDVVVLGTAYRDGPDRMMGSTAESVLNRTSCSLMIVKPLPWLD
ncbi:universal stress protein [Pseudomonas corrugata]|uniref:universal stress protein n=1 Tax=Pseudomonas corrugata TaxID=47879 RepID=UPI0015863AF7|nr:universal stress protein [Pseudomonas corrugata]MCI0996803.1 universal stress protein [Pseudomonas corrugata]NUT68932.1 universal stress protein [Pseudomonas corrugata]